MKTKSATKAQDTKQVDPSGIPLLVFPSAVAGVCPICLGAADVRTHRKGGYHLRCTACGAVIFTKSAHGAITFRAYMEVLTDPELCHTLVDLTRIHLPYFTDQMLKASLG